MKDQNLENELKKLREELNHLKEKSMIQKFKEKSRFAQGVIIGLSMTAVVAIAGQIVKTYTFGPGSPIFSAEVNANFDDLFTKVNDMNKGFIANLSVDQVITCDAGGVTKYDVQFDTIGEDDGGYNAGTFTYTVTTAGYYSFAANIHATTTPMLQAQEVLINGTPKLFSLYGTPVIINLNAADTIKIQVSCDSKKGATQTISATDNFFSLIKAL